MKKNYLLIIDLFFIESKTSLSQGLTSLVTKLLAISIKGGEFELIKAIKKPVFYKLILVLLTGLSNSSVEPKCTTFIITKYFRCFYLNNNFYISFLNHININHFDLIVIWVEPV